MRIVLLQSTDLFDKFRNSWNALLASSTTNNVFLTWEWQSTWWRIYGRKRALRILLAYDGTGQLCGIAPLYRATIYIGPLRFRTLEFIGGRHVASEYLDFIARSDVHTEVVADFLTALRSQRQWDLLLGFHMPADSPTVAALNDPTHGLTWKTTDQLDSLYVPPAADWDSYLGRLGKLTRRNVRYYRKGVESKLGATVCDLRDKIPETLPQLITLHQMRMRQLGFPGSFASARFVRFHEQVAQLFAEKGWGRLFALRAGDKLIAANYGFAYNGTFSDYSMGFDPAYRDHSVGFVLFSHMLERCMQERLEVDFLDPGQFKELWNPLRRPKVSYAVGASPALLSAYARAAVARSFVNRTLKRAFPARMASRIGVWKDSLLSRFS